MTVIRSFAPLAGPEARLLILGSMPGEASLRAGQYYAHPRNLFWRLLGDLLAAPLAELPYEQRPPVLAAHGVAVWDVLASCQRSGSLDSAILGDSIQVNDFVSFLAGHPGIRHVFFNGTMAARTFRRFVLPQLAAHNLCLQGLPSSSPAHAALDYGQKLEQWRQALLPILRGSNPV